MTEQRLFCFGYGYVAHQLAQQFPSWRVKGTSRSKPGFIPFTGQAPINEQYFKDFDSFLISIPPTDQGDIVLKNHRHLFESYRDKIQWIGYLSATSVYGDHHGNWVDETSPTWAKSVSAKERLFAEQEWLDLYRTMGLPIHIFRLSGIYGPHRNILTTITQGQGQIIGKKDHVFSRIHVNDICQILSHSMKTPHPGSIYNVADDVPASSSDVMAYGYHLLNLPSPPPIPFEQAPLSPRMQEFYSDHKRVKNTKIKEELGIILHYPSYKEGLKNCWLEEYDQKTD